VGIFSDLFNWLGGFFNTLLHWFHDLFEWLRKHIIRHLVAVLTAAYEIAAQIATQIKRVIQKIRDWYFKHVFPIQRKLLQIISVLRVFLALLRLLGVKWAAKLDADLRKIQGYITDSILAVVTTLNTIDSYLSLIVSPGFVLSSAFLHASFGSSLAALKRFAGYGSNAPLSAEDQQAEQDSQRLGYSAAPLTSVDAEGHVTFDPAYQNILTDSDRATGDLRRQIQ
jgi:hypothetical protein